MRESGDAFLWDLVDACDSQNAEYMRDLGDALAIRLGQRPDAVTLPGADA